MRIENATTSSNRKSAESNRYLAGATTASKVAIQVGLIVVCFLASCSPAGSSTQQTIVEPAEPGATEVFVEPTSTSTREPTATPTPTQEPTPTATQELQPMYQGPLADMAENFDFGAPSITEFSFAGVEYSWFEINLFSVTLVSERPVVIGWEPYDWGRENTVLEDIWGFALNGEEHLFRTYRIGAIIWPPVVLGNGVLEFLRPMAEFPNLEPGTAYGVWFCGFISEVPEYYFEEYPDNGRYNIMPNARPILENMLIDPNSQQALLDFFRYGVTGHFPVDGNGIVDLRQVVLPYVRNVRE